MTNALKENSLVKGRHRVIIIDFDHTLFNTTKFTAALQKKLEKFGIDKKTFFQYRQAAKDCCRFIDIDNFVAKLPYNDRAQLHAAVHEVIKKQAREFIFADVRSFVEKHRDNFDILIITQGDKELQTEKIKHSRLPKEVKHIITTDGKGEALAKIIPRYDEVHFIDDKAKHIDEVKKKFPKAITYFIQRPEDKPYADQPSKCKCTDQIVKNLQFIIA